MKRKRSAWENRGMITSKTYLTVEELAMRWKVSKQTIYNLKYNRQLPFVKIPGHRTVYPLDEIERMEKEGFHAERT